MLHQPRELTPRSTSVYQVVITSSIHIAATVWKQIQPKLEQAIANEKRRRAERETELQYGKRVNELTEQYANFLEETGSDLNYPTISELVGVPEVAEVLRAEGATVVMTKERFKECLPRIHAIKRRNQLDLLQKLFGKPDSVDETLLEGHSRDTPELEGLEEQEHVRHRATSVFSFGNGDFGSLMHCDDPEVAQEWSQTHTYVVRRAARLIDQEIPLAMLKMLKLPEDVRYADVSGKVLCKCRAPDFKQPASFVKLVNHRT